MYRRSLFHLLAAAALPIPAGLLALPPRPSVPVTGKERRISTGFAEVDRVLEGGLVYPSVTLLAAAPGVGRAMLATQIADHVGRGGNDVLYATYSSNLSFDMRCRSLGAEREHLHLVSTTRAQAIQAEAQRLRPRLVVVDDVYSTRADDAADDPSTQETQVQALARFLQRLSLTCDAAVLLLGYESTIELLEHTVDATLILEKQRVLYTLRSRKNRFNSTAGVGVLLERTSRGLRDVSFTNFSVTT